MGSTFVSRALAGLRSWLGAAAIGACSSAPAAYPPEAAGARPDVRAYFFGHSLVDQDMPAMVGALARARGHGFAAYGQLGWGTSLAAHVGWDGAWAGAPLGFVEENRGRPFFAGEGKAQLDAGRYDSLVLTETNGFTKGKPRDTVRAALALARRARAARPDTRVFLYANWLNRHDEGGNAPWIARTRADLAWWEQVADAVSAELGGAPVFVLPVGRVLAEVVERADEGRLPGLATDQLFRKDPGAPGGIDGVHVSDLGFYVVALVHYAALFHDTPVGLPAHTEREDGPAEAFDAATATAIQHIVYDALRAYPRAGATRI